MKTLQILYQDDGLVAVDKSAGILVHQTRIPESDDQVAMKILRDQLGQKIYTIHRLDRPTSGVLLFIRRHGTQHSGLRTNWTHLHDVSRHRAPFHPSRNRGSNRHPRATVPRLHVFSTGLTGWTGLKNCP